MSSFRWFHPPSWRYLSPLLVLGFAACESDRRPPPGPPPEAVEVASPELEAEGMFFDRQIQVETVLNRTGFAGRGHAAAGETDDSPRTNGDGGRRGGGRSGGGGRGRGAGSGATASEGPGNTSSEAAPRLHTSNLPSLRLHLRLTNLGSDPVEVAVNDFDSDLGNFVVQPSTLSLPPHTAVEADPMISRLGVASDAIPLTVSLRLGDRTEKQVLVLRPVKPATPATGPVTPP